MSPLLQVMFQWQNQGCQAVQLFWFSLLLFSPVFNQMYQNSGDLPQGLLAISCTVWVFAQRSVVHVCCLTKEICSFVLYMGTDIFSSQQYLSIYSWLIMEAEQSYCSSLCYCQWELVVLEERDLFFFFFPFPNQIKHFLACWNISASCSLVCM